MFRFSLIALCLTAASLSNAHAAEKLQFEVELSLDGCVNDERAHHCGGNNEFTRESISIDMKCAGRDCEMLVGRYQKEFSLRWLERGEERKLRLSVNASKHGSGEEPYIFSLALDPENGGENDSRSTMLGLKDFSSLGSISLSGKTEEKPGPGEKTSTLWASLSASRFHIFQGE
ncbi:MAG: hypothetical protein EOP11_19100 [Proteobacteria bacterium]|nr:MAG: hypothetical protein EOP11_19100 [Pseudomonadota bacterium]